MAHYGRSDDDESNRLKGQAMSRITCMRMLCSHPQLLLASAEAFDDEESSTGSEYASFLKEEGLLDRLPKSSVKMDALMDILTEQLGPDSKVVVFSGFKPQLSLIADGLRAKEIGYTTITGDTPSKDRKDRMDLFQTHPEVNVFLSSDAGAYGINLDKGTHLINYDLPWSAGALEQRVARIDRTSSLNDHIYLMYMFSSGTIEERQYEMLKQKSKVAGAFVDGDFDTSTGTLSLDLSSLREFLSD